MALDYNHAFFISKKQIDKPPYNGTNYERTMTIKEIP
jgi:hypothetical protein